MRVNRLSGIVMRLTVILLCLVLFSAHLASGMFAKYTVKADQDGQSRAAKYGVQVISDEDGDPLDTALNGDVVYHFRVDNSASEVPVKYETIQIGFSDCFVGDVKVSDVDEMFRNVTLNDREATEVITQDKGVIYVFTVNRMLRPGSTSGVFELKFNTYPSWVETTDSSMDDNVIRIDNRYRYPVSIFVDAEQID